MQCVESLVDFRSERILKWQFVESLWNGDLHNWDCDFSSLLLDLHWRATYWLRLGYYAESVQNVVISSTIEVLWSNHDCLIFDSLLDSEKLFEQLANVFFMNTW